MPKINIKHDYMLWGLEKAPKNKIKEVYGTADKPKKEDIPDKIDKEVIEEVKPVEEKQEFKLKKLDDYTTNDIEYLEEEYNKLDAIVDAMEASNPDVDKIINLQNDLYEIIEQLKYKREMEDKPKDIVELDWDKITKLNDISELNRIKYIESKGTDLNAKKKWEDADKEIAKLYKMAGRGFKRGSPEAKEHARKMAEAKKTKEVKSTKSSKSKEDYIEVKSTKSSKSKRPYYQFKPIPTGYRGANEDEAILSNKVGKFGLFVVNPDKIKYYEEYDYLLSENLPIINVRGYVFGLKRKIKRALEDIEIAKNRLDNNPDNVKYKNNLEDAKYSKTIFTKFYKWYCKKYNIPYKKIVLEKKEISDGKLKENIVIPKYEEYFKKPVDIRQPKNIDEKNEYIFEKDGIIIRLNVKYFKDGKLKSSYAKKLYDRNILLDSIYYTEADRKKYFYNSNQEINGGKLKFKLSTISNKLNPTNWVGKSGRKGMIQLGQLTHDEILPAVVEYGKPIYEEAARYGATALTGNPELGDLASKTLWDKMGAKYDPRKYANQINVSPQEIENAKRKPKERLQRIGFSRFT